MAGDSPTHTLPHAGSLPLQSVVRRFSLAVIEPAERATVFHSQGDRVGIGSAPANDLVVDEKTVSRFHCEVVLGDEGARIVDLDSRNGTFLDGVRVKDAFLRDGATLRCGAATIRFQYGAENNKLALSSKTTFGRMVGRSFAARATFALLERAALTDATMLLEGETGTGKGAAAEAVHQQSARAARPFIIVDCGAIPANLLESELFGHEKGSFTGASERRIGAFEEAEGGTIFLDEIGELPGELQPKLLRVLESRQIKRVGQNQHKTVDVRLVAATNRDLRAEVNAGRFRADLYYRLAVVRVPMPSLRARPEDIPALAETILASLGASEAQREKLLSMAFIGTLQRASWPGNVRELRNYLERCLVFEEPQPTGIDNAPHGGHEVDASRPYGEERQKAIDEFERRYVEGLLRLHGGKVTAAAAAAGVARVHLYRLMRRHGLTR